MMSRETANSSFRNLKSTDLFELNEDANFEFIKVKKRGNHIIAACICVKEIRCHLITICKTTMPDVEIKDLSQLKNILSN